MQRFSAEINVATYLFGCTSGKYIQYPQDYTQDFFENISKKSVQTSQSFIAIHRKGNMMYYIYVRRKPRSYIDELQNRTPLKASNSYVGMCISLNSIMLKELAPLFRIFENLIEHFVIEEKILSVYEKAIVIADEPTDIINNKLNIARSIIDKAIKDVVEELYIDLPPVSYGVESQTIQTFNILKDKEEDIFDKSHKYSLSFVYKDNVTESSRLTETIREFSLASKNYVSKQEEGRENALFAFIILIVCCFTISYKNISPKIDAYKTVYDNQKSRTKDYKIAIDKNNKEIKSNKENILLTERKILSAVKNNAEKIKNISELVPIIFLHISGDASEDTLTIDFVGNVLSEDKKEIPLGIKIWNNDGKLLRGEKSPNGYTHIEKLKVIEGNNFSITLTNENTGVYSYSQKTQIEITYNGFLLANKDLDL